MHIREFPDCVENFYNITWNRVQVSTTPCYQQGFTAPGAANTSAPPAARRSLVTSYQQHGRSLLLSTHELKHFLLIRYVSSSSSFAHPTRLPAIRMIKTVDVCALCFYGMLVSNSPCLLVRAAFLSDLTAIPACIPSCSRCEATTSVVSTFTGVENAACVWLSVYKLLMTSSSPSSQASGHVSVRVNPPSERCYNGRRCCFTL